jgi:hypothetical protein
MREATMCTRKPVAAALPLICLVVATNPQPGAWAGVIWDEANDGDLSNFLSTPTMFHFSSQLENSIINGSIGGSSTPEIGDGFDVFEFIVAIEGRLEEFRFDTYEGIVPAQLDIYLFDNLVLSSTVSAGDVDRNYVEDIKAASPAEILSGFFTVQLANFSIPGQRYSLTYVATIPEPATRGMLACCLGLMMINGRSVGRGGTARFGSLGRRAMV